MSKSTCPSLRDSFFQAGVGCANPVQFGHHPSGAEMTV
jgi:hypothetical protein